jgi:hypothetical protein
LLLSAAIVEDLELVWVCCGWPTPPTAHSFPAAAQSLVFTFLHISATKCSHCSGSYNIVKIRAAYHRSVSGKHIYIIIIQHSVGVE